MAQTIVEINCPGCGARVSIDQKECEWCHNPVIVSTFNSVFNMPMPKVSENAGAYRKALAEEPDNKEYNTMIAMCYLKLKLYDKALPAFEKAIEDNFDNSETYFYAAICLLAGKKPFSQQKPTINKIEEYINAALMIEAKGIYYYFLAYIKKDYYGRKFLKVSPTCEETLMMATDAGVSDYDIQQLFEILGNEKPLI